MKQASWESLKPKTEGNLEKRSVCSERSVCRSVVTPSSGLGCSREEQAQPLLEKADFPRGSLPSPATATRTETTVLLLLLRGLLRLPLPSNSLTEATLPTLGRVHFPARKAPPGKKCPPLPLLTPPLNTRRTPPSLNYLISLGSPESEVLTVCVRPFEHCPILPCH